MSLLLETQHAFAAALLDSSGGPPMDAYRANVYGNWSNALGAACPVVRKIVGKEFFEGMVREYSRVHPSRSGDLNEYGAELPAFVAAFPHTQDLPYLPDVARMEWLVHRAYYAADAAPFDLNSLSSVPPERYSEMRITLAPACALLASDWPLARIWAAHQDGREGEAAVDLAAGPDRILVARPGWRAEVCSVGRGDFRFLEAALAGGPLAAALEAAASEDPSFDPSMALACWVQAGVIVDLQ